MYTEQQNNRNFANIWELYGVKFNPFATSPLLVKGGVLPVESFVGRKGEMSRLIKQFRSFGGSRCLIVGEVGVGKTTFANVARRTAIANGYFSPLKEIGVQENWSVNDFIINTLYAIYSTINLEEGWKKRISNTTYDKLKNLVELASHEMHFGGVGVLGMTALVNQERRTPTHFSYMALYDLFDKVISEIHKSTGKEVIIHYNNLERLTDEVIRMIFNDLRDFFQIPHVHFIFIGNLIVHGVLQSMPRFASILSDTPILLKELSLEQVNEVINIRMKKLRIEDLEIVRPFDDSALEMLYDLYGGNIRDILNSLETAVLYLTEERPVTIDSNMLAMALRESVEKRYLSALNSKARELLEAVVRSGEITNKELSVVTNTAAPNVSNYLKELQNEGCIYLKRREGKDKYWAADAKIKWMLLEPIGEKRSKTVKSGNSFSMRLPRNKRSGLNISE
ncbi:MAG: winged helix-turn-helix transcriptional regulator [Candidatus Marsarchaeota archaeon]|nr:winged helix-turn-helix transcriptional regulator [Candidatus Marsarchaeota archaeon]